MKPEESLGSDKHIVALYTASDILKLIERKVLEIVSSDNFKGHVIVEGILGEIKNTNYQYCYGVSLRDTAGNAINLDIPKRIAEQSRAYQNKEVRIYGYLKPSVWQGSVKFTVDTTRIEPKTEVSEELQEQEKLLSDFLRTHRREGKLFPDREKYIVSVIHPLSAQVKSDFERQIGDLSVVSIDFKPVNILSVEDIIEAINTSRGDILVIVRGGGSDSEFEIFNDFRLLEAWINKKAFKISALGHTGHRTYLDTFSDVSADTPTDAGAFIKKNIETLNILKDYGNLSVRHKKDIDELYRKLTEEWTRKLDELQKQKDEEIKRLNDRIIASQKEMKETVETANKQKDTAVREVMNKLERREQELNRQIAGLTQQVQTLKTHRWIAIGAAIILLLFLIMR